MENASKALLIAGAILICILLIAVGMYVYKSAQGTITTAAAQMGQQEKEMYNATISKYIGDSKKGSDVKQLIDTIISNNNQNVGESGKFISIHNGPTETDKEKNGGYTAISSFTTDLNDAGKKANVYEDSTGDNTQDKIDDATTVYRAFAQKISSGKNYKVESKQEDGIIYAVYISTKENYKKTTP